MMVRCPICELVYVHLVAGGRVVSGHDCQVVIARGLEALLPTSSDREDPTDFSDGKI